MINLYPKPKEAILNHTFRIVELYDEHDIDDDEIVTFEKGNKVLVLGEFEILQFTQCIVFCPTAQESTTMWIMRLDFIGEDE